MSNCAEKVICLYRENGRKEIKPEFLEESIYNAAMRSFVVVCTDAIIMDMKNKVFYLAKRRIRPWKDWWVVGGRSFTGQNPKKSVVSCFERETSLRLPEKRFKLLSINRYMWKDREQEPQDFGSDNLAYTFVVQLSKREIEIVSQNLNKDEYESTGLEKFDLKRMKLEKVHPMIIKAYRQIFNKKRKKN